MESIESPPDQPQISGSYITPLLISMLGIVLTTLALIVYYFIVARYCHGRRALQEIGGAMSHTAAGDGQLGNGVDEKVLKKIPIVSYSSKKSDIFRVDQVECVVCLGELADGDLVRLLPICKHAFHVSCIDKWFMARSSCPICRAPVVAPITWLSLADEGGDDMEVISDDPSSRCDGGSNNIISISRAERGLLPRSASFISPTEVQYSISGFGRSLSMNHSNAINLQKESESASSSSSLSSCKDGHWRTDSYHETSLRHMDRVSLMLLRSFSRLKVAPCITNNEILPQ